MKTKTTKETNLTADNLSEVLWNAIRDLRSKKMKPQDANAISSMSREICRVKRTQLDYMKAYNIKGTSTAYQKFLT